MGRRAMVYVIRGPEGAYVGQTVDPERRWREHQRLGFERSRYLLGRAARKLRRSPLAKSMRKHGRKAFTFEIVAVSTRVIDNPGCWCMFGDVLEKTVAEQITACGETLLNVAPFSMR